MDMKTRRYLAAGLAVILVGCYFLGSLARPSSTVWDAPPLLVQPAQDSGLLVAKVVGERVLMAVQLQPVAESNRRAPSSEWIPTAFTHVDDAHLGATLLREVARRAPSEGGPNEQVEATELEQWVAHRTLDASASGPDDAAHEALHVASNSHVHVRLADLGAHAAWWWRVCAIRAPKIAREGMPTVPVDVCRKANAQTTVGRVATQPRAGASNFSVAVLADSHLLMPWFHDDLTDDDIAQFMEQDRPTREKWWTVLKQMQLHQPDLVLHLGDPFDLHGLGFMPNLSSSNAANTYRVMRALLSELPDAGAYLTALGNWEGETGCAGLPSSLSRLAAAAQRLLYFPPPTTPAPRGEYYKVEWGDLLLVVLSVLSYTPTCHALTVKDLERIALCEQAQQQEGASPEQIQTVCDNLTPQEGGPTDFTLGDEQKAFVEHTLSSSTAAFKIVAAHHTVGGAAGDDANSAYGRGGDKAAHVGEQAWLHEQMRTHEVQVFLHGHDHLFNDVVVDGIHYTCCGSTGAPWMFVQEGGYSPERIGAGATFGHVKLEVTPEQLSVRMIAGETGAEVGGYKVAPLRPPATSTARQKHAQSGHIGSQASSAEEEPELR